MEITTTELKSLQENTYKIIDIRNAMELSYGAIPGAENQKSEELLADPPENKELRYVIVCRQGINSKETAEALEELGYSAVSLKGGYNAWLLDQLEEQDKTMDDAAYAAQVEKSLQKTFRKCIWSNFVKALKDYKLVNEGDCVAVCISGGKDSMLLAKLFQLLKRYSEVNFDVKYLVMDPGYSKANRKIIEDNARRLGIPIRIFESDIFESVFDVEKSPCYLCARMRRGHLYSYAKEMGCNKIALGHHFDDVIETTLMGMLWGAQVQTMMPKLHSTNFEGMELIRPLYYVREEDIKRWRDTNGLHFIQCACKFTENSVSNNNEENQSKRVEVKNLIREMKKTNPYVETNIFRSMENVMLDTTIAYKTKGVRHHFLDTYEEEHESGI